MADKKTMALEEFQEAMQADVARFVIHWEKQRKTENAKDWPLRMEASDDHGSARSQWDDQLRAFLGWE